MKILKKFIDKHPDLLQNTKQTLLDLEDDPFKPSLKTHKLSGSLSGKYACSINYEYRLVVKMREKNIYLLNIGSHDEVYG